MEQDQQLSVNSTGQKEVGHGVCSYILIGLAFCLVAITLPFSLLVCINVLQEYERAVIFRLGVVVTKGVLTPGLIFKLPCVDEVQVCDIRTKSYETKRQQLLTTDSATVTVNGAVYADITNPRMMLIQRVNVHAAVRTFVSNQLRKAVGGVTLTRLIQDKKRISSTLQITLTRTLKHWGVHMQRIDIGVFFLPTVARGSDITLPNSFVRALATEAETSREAKAKLLAAKGEVRASRLLKEAADVLGASTCAMELRYLETVRQTAANNNHSIVIPFPPQQILQAFGRLLSAVLPRLAGPRTKHAPEKRKHPVKPSTKGTTGGRTHDIGDVPSPRRTANTTRAGEIKHDVLPTTPDTAGGVGLGLRRGASPRRTANKTRGEKTSDVMLTTSDTIGGRALSIPSKPPPRWTSKSTSV